MTGKRVISGQMAHDRLLREAKMVRDSLLEISKNGIKSFSNKTDIVQKEEGNYGEKFLKSYFLLPFSSFLEKFMASCMVKGVSSFYIFSLELVFSLYLEISERLKECTVKN